MKVMAWLVERRYCLFYTLQFLSLTIEKALVAVWPWSCESVLFQTVRFRLCPGVTTKASGKPYALWVVNLARSVDDAALGHFFGSRYESFRFASGTFLFWASYSRINPSFTAGKRIGARGLWLSSTSFLFFLFQSQWAEVGLVAASATGLSGWEVSATTEKPCRVPMIVAHWATAWRSSRPYRCPSSPSSRCPSKTTYVFSILLHKTKCRHQSEVFLRDRCFDETQCSSIETKLFYDEENPFIKRYFSIKTKYFQFSMETIYLHKNGNVLWKRTLYKNKVFNMYAVFHKYVALPINRNPSFNRLFP